MRILRRPTARGFAGTGTDSAPDFPDLSREEDIIDQEWLTAALKLAAAFAAALPVAWERERETRIMGLRTFPLVAVASCGYVLVALGTGEQGGEAEARAVQGLMTGIGFLGGGAILKDGGTVRGTATAASVWSTGAIGGAAGFGLYGIAVLIGIINFATLRLMSRFEDHRPEAKGKEQQGG